jgi:hypothetical protein
MNVRKYYLNNNMERVTPGLTIARVTSDNYEFTEPYINKYDLIMDLQIKCDKIAEEMVSMPLEADRTVITTRWSVLHDLLEELKNS